jgi:hypothetical protein
MCDSGRVISATTKRRKTISQRTLVLLVAVIAIVILVVPIVTYISTYDSSFNLSLDIVNEGPDIEEFTVILPCPQNSEFLSRVNDSGLGTSTYPQESVSFDYALESVVTTSGVVYMLRVWTISSTFPSGSQIYLGSRIDSSHRINTDNPIGREPLMEPIMNVTQIPDGGQSTSNAAYDIVFDSMYFTSYVSNESTGGISIWLRWEGWNEWFLFNSQGTGFAQHLELNLMESHHAIPQSPHVGWNAVQGGISTDL